MNAIYQHFRPEEYDFIDQMFETIMKVADEYTPKLTHFLDPRQLYITETIAKNNGLKISAFGGLRKAERVRAFIYPDYYQPSKKDFDITLFHIHYPVKFTKLSHQKILGSLMSLGIKREIFGDIITDGTKWQMYIQAEMKEYMSAMLFKIGSVNIELEEVPLEEAITPNERWIEQMVTASSTRVDAVVTSSFPISRQKAKQLVQSGFVKVNWQTLKNPSFTCEKGDIISMRGYGRIKIMELCGQTKKDKIRLKMGFLK